ERYLEEHGLTARARTFTRSSRAGQTASQTVEDERPSWWIDAWPPQTRGKYDPKGAPFKTQVTISDQARAVIADAFHAFQGSRGLETGGLLLGPQMTQHRARFAGRVRGRRSALSEQFVEPRRVAVGCSACDAKVQPVAHAVRIVWVSHCQVEAEVAADDA